jgi:hypothetical protein
MNVSLRANVELDVEDNSYPAFGITAGGAANEYATTAISLSAQLNSHDIAMTQPPMGL